MKDDSFFERVYEITKRIPEGRVTTYGAIARYTGSPGAARMVGWALNKVYTREEFIPAHRVVNRKGLLTGKQHFHGPEVMKELLENEGIHVKDDQVLDFQNVFWDPNKDLPDH